MKGMGIGLGNKMEAVDEVDLNSFSIKPDALIYFTIAQVVGITAKAIDQNKSITDICMMKSELVDDLETLCESQDYVYEEGVEVKGEVVKDPYYKIIEDKNNELGLSSGQQYSSEVFWHKKMQLSNLKFKLLCKRIFKGSSKPKDWVY